MTSASIDRRLGLSGNTAVKTPVTVVATSNLTLSGEQTIDGIALLATNAAGKPDRVLCTGQTTASQNGIWDVNTGSWTRSRDANGNYDLVNGTQVVVSRGSAAKQVWILTTADPITIGTTSQTWSQNLSSGFLATLAAAGGAGLVGFSASSSYSASTVGYELAMQRRVLATGVAATDTANIAAALAAMPQYSTLFLIGSFVINATLTISVDNTLIIGPAKLTAAANVNFDNMLIGTSRTGVVVQNILFDANKANRSAGQNVRFLGAGFSASTDCGFINCEVTGTRGFGGVSSVGIFLGGGCTRGFIHQCRAHDCGDPGFDSDAFFTKGTQNVISASVAYLCTDTGFVVEDSDYSGIVGCSSYRCAAGGGITAAINGVDHRGNYVAGLTIRDWSGANTGGFQVGIIGAVTGNLYDTTITGLEITADTASYGVGPAFYVRSDAGGTKPNGVMVSGLRVRGATTQGAVVIGDDVTFVGPDIQGTTDSCIQFGTAALSVTGGQVIGGRLKGGTYGVTTNNVSEASVHQAKCLNQTSYGLYAFNTSTLEARLCDISGAATGSYGKDAGATLSAALEEREVTITYSANMATDAAAGNLFVITATNGVAFTIAAPTNAVQGRSITYTIRNAAGGALGAATWDAAFKMSAWTNPANGNSRSITFKYNGTNWVQVTQTGVDVPN